MSTVTQVRGLQQVSKKGLHWAFLVSRTYLYDVKGLHMSKDEN